MQIYLKYILWIWPCPTYWICMWTAWNLALIWLCNPYKFLLSPLDHNLLNFALKINGCECTLEEWMPRLSSFYYHRIQKLSVSREVLKLIKLEILIRMHGSCKISINLAWIRGRISYVGTAWYGHRSTNMLGHGRVYYLWLVWLGESSA